MKLLEKGRRETHKDRCLRLSFESMFITGKDKRQMGDLVSRLEMITSDELRGKGWSVREYERVY